MMGRCRFIKRTTATRVFSILFGLLVLVAFVYYVGVGSVERILLSVNPILILVMVVLQLSSFVFYASAWYLLIKAAGYRMRFLTCQEITLASIFAVYTMPSGVFLEAARCIFGAKETGMKLGESTATVILHRILYVVGFLASTAVALIALLASGMMSSTTLVELGVVPVVTVAALIILLLLSFDPKRIGPLLDRILRLAQPIIRLIQKEAVVEGKADQFLGEYKSGFRRMVSSRREMMLSLAASVGDWACSVMILWIVLISMGANTSLWVVMITMAIGKMIQMTPIAIPGMIGVYEAAITTVLALFHIPIPIAASAALLSRIVTVWLELPITGIAAYHLGFRLLRPGPDDVTAPLRA
jgi:uncharacterized protein (TIRG00374 family)